MDKKKERVVEKIACVCTRDTGLFIPNRHVTIALSGSLSIVFFVFIIGFFGGQRYAMGQFAQKLDQDSFADHIYSSICSLCDQPETNDETGCDQEEQEEEGQAKGVEIKEEAEKLPSEPLTRNAPQAKQSDDRYYAQLIGFGNEKSAQRFAKRLKDQGLPVIITARKSKTARGKAVAWYQVVTEQFDNKEELSTLVERITKQERLKDVVITSC